MILYLCFANVETHVQKDHPGGQDPHPDPRLDSLQYMTMYKVFIEKTFVLYL